MKRTLSPWSELVPVMENRSGLRATRRLASGLERNRFASAFHPLFLHGPTGTGKTTLVDALRNTVLAIPDGRIVTSILANDIDPRGNEERVETYRELVACDLLIIEDWQFLAEWAVGWAGQLLDDRRTHRRPTVCTANVGPAALRALPRRLTSRLSAGLVVPLLAYSPKSRLRILREFAKREAVQLEPEAVKWIADRPTGGGVRPLLGMVRSLKSAGRNPLHPWTVSDIVQRLGETTGAVDLNRIIPLVASAFGVKEKDVRGATRLKTVMLARQAAMFLAREVGQLSLPAIGRLFGRDHTSVLHAIRKIEELRASDVAFRSKLDALRAELS